MLKRCESQARVRIAQEDNGEVVLTDEDMQLFVQWFNELLAKNKKMLVGRVFGNSNLSIGDIRLLDYSRVRPITLAFRPEDEFVRSSLRGEHQVSVPLGNGGRLPPAYWLHRTAILVAWQLVGGDSAGRLVRPGLQLRMDSEPLFLAGITHWIHAHLPGARG
ncbi:hypothetical protein MASR2M50_04740 [Thauera sp.]